MRLASSAGKDVMCEWWAGLGRMWCESGGLGWEGCGVRVVGWAGKDVV